MADVTLNPKPLAPAWFARLVESSTLGQWTPEAFVDDLWQGLMKRGHHCCDPFFHTWELHLYTYGPEEYDPDPR